MKRFQIQREELYGTEDTDIGNEEYSNDRPCGLVVRVPGC
jgi:hypothetical protein